MACRQKQTSIVRNHQFMVADREQPTHQQIGVSNRVIQDPTGTMKQQRNADMFIDDMTAEHNGGQVDCNEQQLMDM
eukprot:13693506-Ditylum_brightwellii.AAC.1